MAARKQARATRRIALAFPNTMVIAGSLLHGILDYARVRGGWSFTRMPEQLSPAADWLRGWQGDGAFATLVTADEIRMTRSLPFPVINLVGYLFDADLPTATLDHRQIGRLQAEHLLERHFKRLVYYGTSDLWYSRERLTGFQAAAQKRRVCPAVWLVPSGLRASRHWTDQQADLADRLSKVKKPFAVAASTDLRASMVLEACAALGLRVPEDVAVIGVDNDPTVAPFTTPPLSSVARDDYELGRQAAIMLDGLIEHRHLNAPHIQTPPSGVVTRRSTETLAVEDPEIAALIQTVRRHINQAFGVEFLLSRTRLSRRQLERLFRNSLSCSPYALINRLRVEQARSLLETSGRCSLTKIAAASGFTDLRRFRLVFKQETGVSPAHYRKRNIRG